MPRFPRSLRTERMRVGAINDEEIVEISRETDLYGLSAHCGWVETRPDYLVSEVFKLYGWLLPDLFPLMPPGSRVLDLGSGDLAVAASQFQLKNKHLIFEGVTAPVANREIPRSRSQVKVYREEMLKFLMKHPNSYDLIYSTFAVMYHPYPWLLLEVAFRALKPGGTMLIEGVRFPIFLREMHEGREHLKICEDTDLNSIVNRQLADTGSWIEFKRPQDRPYPMAVIAHKSVNTAAGQSIKIPFTTGPLNETANTLIRNVQGVNLPSEQPAWWVEFLGRPKYGFFIDHEYQLNKGLDLIANES